jgi:hypothetical protein
MVVVFVFFFLPPRGRRRRNNDGSLLEGQIGSHVMAKHNDKGFEEPSNTSPPSPARFCFLAIGVVVRASNLPFNPSLHQREACDCASGAQGC